MTYLFWSEAHWLLAVYYMKIAHNMPKRMQGLFDEVKDYKCMQKIVSYLLIICPVLALVAWIL